LPFRHAACRTVLDQAITTTIRAVLHRSAPHCAGLAPTFEDVYLIHHCLPKTLNLTATSRADTRNH
jgi:hypothetical protein